MTFGEIMKNFPKSAQIMAKHGLHCIGCHIAVTETLAEGASAHGFSNEKLKQLIEDLNTNGV
jgi:hybrid cluster-associated redox disulfide protein